MKEISPEKRSSLISPPTDGLNAYLAIQSVYNDVNRMISKKMAKWRLSVPKYGAILQLYDHKPLPLSEMGGLILWK